MVHKTTGVRTVFMSVTESVIRTYFRDSTYCFYTTLFKRDTFHIILAIFFFRGINVFGESNKTEIYLLT